MSHGSKIGNSQKSPQVWVFFVKGGILTFQDKLVSLIGKRNYGNYFMGK